MNDHSLHRGKKKHFCPYCVHAFITKDVVKRHIKDCFKINGKQTVNINEKSEHVKFKNFERKLKSSFIIYTDFESILVLEDNKKQTTNESYTNKYQEHVACSYGYKL